MSNDPTSTGQSYLDQAKGAVQGVIGAVTGNTADQVSYIQDNFVLCLVY